MSIPMHDVSAEASTSRAGAIAASDPGRPQNLPDEIDIRRKEKRKRQSLDPLEGEQDASGHTSTLSLAKGKGRAVSFAEDDSAGSHQAVLPPTAEASAASAPNGTEAPRKWKGEGKTVAKKRYLKAKMARYKAKKRSEQPVKGDDAESSTAGDTQAHQDPELKEGAIDKAAGQTPAAEEETLEQRRLRKKVKREQRRSLRGPDDHTASVESDLQSVNGTGTSSNTAGGTANGQRPDEAFDTVIGENERLDGDTVKTGRELHVDIEQKHSPTAAVDEPVSMQEARRLAKLDELKARQKKANKRAEARLKHGADNGQQPADELEALEPTQPDALPRFPKPVQPSAPSQRELDNLLVSHNLRNAVVVSQNDKLSLRDFQARYPNYRLSEHTLNHLTSSNIQELFAVQAAVIPMLLKDKRVYATRGAPRDICVSAPTGSGKTFSYALPIVEVLAPRVVTRLRALVVLPTRELVTQVRDVFEHLCKGTGLRVAAATGQHSFFSEQTSLVAERNRFIQGGSSSVDILVVTPGRLMDHLNATRNFTLQHLRFLVIDEADRLLSQNFNDWLKVLHERLQDDEVPSEELQTAMGDGDEASILAEPAYACAPHALANSYGLPGPDLKLANASPVQKLLFSATMTRDPSRIGSLKLRNPIYLTVTDRAPPDQHLEDAQTFESDRQFTLPGTLTENMIVTNSADKVAALIHLLYSKHIENALCFTKSVDSAARLVMLLEAFAAALLRDQWAQKQTIPRIAHFSSELAPNQRKAVLDSFKKGDVAILVCSDLVARGLDIPVVAHVINYDVPVDIRKYVHRVGRTARAGKVGAAWSLVETQEAKHFKLLLQDATRSTAVKNIKLSKIDLSEYEDVITAAIATLRS